MSRVILFDVGQHGDDARRVPDFFGAEGKHVTRLTPLRVAAAILGLHRLPEGAPEA
ncbi:MAG: hypothetical protein HY028_11060 [Gammaproteobacteria bacterium]|nr:hypothetical protein [Gammaproteobacteria bacterium]